MGRKKRKTSRCKCVLCEKSIRSNGVHLLGSGSKESDILSTLRKLLPWGEFSALTDGRLFVKPHICRTCYENIVQIPSTINAVENLLGKAINTQLYRPKRSVWIHQDGVGVSAAVCQETLSSSVSEKADLNPSLSNLLEKNCFPSGSLTLCFDSECDNVLSMDQSPINARTSSQQLRPRKSTVRADSVYKGTKEDAEQGPTSSLIFPETSHKNKREHKFSSNSKTRRIQPIRKSRSVGTAGIKDDHSCGQTDDVSLNQASPRRNTISDDGTSRKTDVKEPRLFKGPSIGCNTLFLKKEKLDIHMRYHSPDKCLVCEKCGRGFSFQRYLDAHLKVHTKNDKHATNPPARSISCEHKGCTKMFRTRQNMQSHFLNQHKGRKPISVPGVTYPCSFPGCGKSFSFRSTLYRHKKLVHKGGDYKLGRQVVSYPCTYNQSCGQIFNRKNLLEEHMVMVHGKAKSGSRLLPRRRKELDLSESVCHFCGMVLTDGLHERHVRMYHSQREAENVPENQTFPCLLEGCTVIFNTQEDRTDHVLAHIESPPHPCSVETCDEVFYLEKNLDNHLWRQHTRKQSTCDLVECGCVFEDQMELAKHSKVHYGGKMKCPWPQCDKWLTENGQLLPHFIAHIRSMRAVRDVSFVCEICHLACTSRWGLMIHKRIHGDEGAALAKCAPPGLVKFTCEEVSCPATFCDQKGFFDHFLSHHTQQACVCPCEGCDQNFNSLVALARHTGVHLENKHQCPWAGCHRQFGSMFSVKRHIYRHITRWSRRESCQTLDGDDLSSLCEAQGEQIKHVMEKQKILTDWPFSCPRCFMVFRLENNLASHMECHSHEKSEYVCPTCGKKGRHSHVKRPPKESKAPKKMFVCAQCETTYASVTSFKYHQLQKHNIGKWPFLCSFCGKGFVSKRELGRHAPTHTKEKPFVCEICGASFASHTGHRSHMRKHTGQKFVCEVEGCGKEYTTPISLKGHMAQHAGFCKICQHCGKTYRNPYSHKCKAGKEKKKKKMTDQPDMTTVEGALELQQQPVALPESSQSNLFLLQPNANYQFAGYDQPQYSEPRPVQDLHPLPSVSQKMQHFQRHQSQALLHYGLPRSAMSGTLSQTQSIPYFAPPLPTSTTSLQQQPQSSHTVSMRPNNDEEMIDSRAMLSLTQPSFNTSNSVLRPHQRTSHNKIVQVPSTSFPSGVPLNMNLLQGVGTASFHSSQHQAQGLQQFETIHVSGATFMPQSLESIKDSNILPSTQSHPTYWNANSM